MSTVELTVESLLEEGLPFDLAKHIHHLILQHNDLCDLGVWTRCALGSCIQRPLFKTRAELRRSMREHKPLILVQFMPDGLDGTS
jgi:hypothetical protein